MTLTTLEIITALRARCKHEESHSDYCGCQVALRMEAIRYLMGLYAPGHLDTDTMEQIIVNTMARIAERRKTDEAE